MHVITFIAFNIILSCGTGGACWWKQIIYKCKNYSSTKFLKMDPKYILQDVLWCGRCKIWVTKIHCYACHKNLCKTCEEEHLSNSSKVQKCVPFRFRRSIPKCQKHLPKMCERFCEHLWVLSFFWRTQRPTCWCGGKTRELKPCVTKWFTRNRKIHLSSIPRICILYPNSEIWFKGKLSEINNSWK